MKLYKLHFIEKESDVTVISESKKAILTAQNEFYIQRKILEKFSSSHKKFLTSFSPVKVRSEHDIINLMVEGALICDVGPMATVAGALVDLMLKKMKKTNNHQEKVKNALIENGGEVINDSEKPMKIALFAGDNELNFNIGFLIEKEDCPIGIATSSATIGHAVSLGQADAVTTFAKSATIADGAATKICNAVKGPDIEKSIKKGLDVADDLSEIRGVLISRKEKIGITGKIPQMVKLEGNKRKVLNSKIQYTLLGDFKAFK